MSECEECVGVRVIVTMCSSRVMWPGAWSSHHGGGVSLQMVTAITLCLDTFYQSSGERELEGRTTRATLKNESNIFHFTLL